MMFLKTYWYDFETICQMTQQYGWENTQKTSAGKQSGMPVKGNVKMVDTLAFLKNDYTEEEIRLVRIKFISEMAN